MKLALGLGLPISCSKCLFDSSVLSLVLAAHSCQCSGHATFLPVSPRLKIRVRLFSIIQQHQNLSD